MQNTKLFYNWNVWSQIPHTSGRFHAPFAFIGELLNNLTEDYQYTMTFKAYQLFIVHRSEGFLIWENEDDVKVYLSLEETLKHFQKLQSQFLSSLNEKDVKVLLKLTPKGLEEYENLASQDEDWEGWEIEKLSRAFFFMHRAFENNKFLDTQAFIGHEEVKTLLIEKDFLTFIETCT